MDFGLMEFWKKPKKRLQNLEKPVSIEDNLKEMTKHFESTLLNFNEITYENLSQVKFKNMNVDQLDGIRFVALEIFDKVKEIESIFKPIQEEIVSILSEIKKNSYEIIHSEQVEELLKIWKNEDEKGKLDVLVNDELAATLYFFMKKLWDEVNKLKIPN